MNELEIYKKELLKWSERVNLIGPEAREHLDACPSCRRAYETFTRLHPSGA